MICGTCGQCGATNLDDSKVHEGQCDHDNFEIVGQDTEEFEDNVL